MMDSTTPDLVVYVLSNYVHLLTPAEWQANRHLTTTLKSSGGRSDARAQDEVRAQHPGSAHWLSNDPEVLALAADGLEAFEARTAQRILDEHPADVFLNYCPKCGGLTRTPRAKWCPHCGHSWH